MPVGGIGAGQLYITGDGRLAHWDIFNLKTAGYGYPRKPAEPRASVEQGFAVHVKKGDPTSIYPLDIRGFPGRRISRQLPAGRQSTMHNRIVPSPSTLKAFSPFIPLNPDDSSLPATVMQFTVEERHRRPTRR